MRRVALLTHAGIVLGLGGLFFGLLALAFSSPYGASLSLASLVLLGGSAFFAWFFGFYPLWRPKGWEDDVVSEGKHFLVSTLPYPPYLSWRRQGPSFGTAVFPAGGGEAEEPALPLYGLHWLDRAEAEKGHRWVVEALRRADFADLEPYKAPLSL